MRFYELYDDEVFNVTSTSNVNNADLIAVITLTYKLSFTLINWNFKFIKLSFKLNLKINYALNYSLSSWINFKALIKFITLSY